MVFTIANMQCGAVPCNNIIFNIGTVVLLFLPSATDIIQSIEPFLAKGKLRQHQAIVVIIITAMTTHTH